MGYNWGMTTILVKKETIAEQIRKGHEFNADSGFHIVAAEAIRLKTEIAKKLSQASSEEEDGGVTKRQTRRVEDDHTDDGAIKRI